MRKSSRRSPWLSGRRMVSLSWPNIAERSSPAPSLLVKPRWFTPNRDPRNPGDPRSLRDPQVLLNIEFHALKRYQNCPWSEGDKRRFVDAAAMVSSPEYSQATAEVRARHRRRVWL